jgi:phosphoribosyl 1,2-cyclic phosphodiesterase
VRVTLWGTRGSLPSAGPENARYGGNTACVEVRGADGSLLVLDAGTGIRRLGATLSKDEKRIDILLSHLHMDHIVGLGFFQPLYWDGLEVHLWGPPSATMDLGARLARYLSPPLFPVRLRDLPCNLTLHDTALEPFEIGDLTIIADLVCHPGPTVGYRITEGNVSLAYLPDHEPALGAPTFPEAAQWVSGYELAVGVDILIHDAQYATDEYPDHVGWGHSTIQQTLDFATATGVKRLVTFHHDPAHTDADLDHLLDEARKSKSLPFELVPGTEGATLQLAG